MSDTDANLIDRIAAKAECSNDVVEQVLGDYGINLMGANRHHRSIRLDRLRVRGDKAGGIEPGAFDETFEFNLGVTVVAAGNFRGKTSILEIVTLVLRGEPRNLQADVLSWIQEVSLDVHINGRPIGFRVTIGDSKIEVGRILAGTTADLEASDDVDSAGVTELGRVQGNENWAQYVGSFMMSEFGLEEMQVFNRGRNDDETGIIKSHGWHSYFGVLYPPSGADKVLLGSTPGDSLPVKLMRVFLDMPEATRSMRVNALAQRLNSEFAAEQRRGRDANAAIASQLQAAQDRLAEAESSLQMLHKQAPAENLEELSQLAVEAGGLAVTARQAVEAAQLALSAAQADRIADTKALNSLRESKVASALFHGLDPKYCPRCETSISAERRSREHDDHQCAVCDRTIHIDDEDDYEERELQASEALAASTAAEKSLVAARDESQTAFIEAQNALRAIDERIAEARGAHQATELLQAENELAAASAVVETLLAMSPEEPEIPLPVTVLDAAREVLQSDIKQVSAELYSELSEATCELARTFGIAELESINIKGNGTMDVTKGGGSKSSFSSQSPGERLRLRYALVIALLRTARERNIAGHPGMLLLDSLKAEEVQDDHAQTLLQGLVDVANEEPGLQILVTTADTGLADAVSGVSGSIVPKQDRTSLF